MKGSDESRAPTEGLQFPSEGNNEHWKFVDNYQRSLSPGPTLGKTRLIEYHSSPAEERQRPEPMFHQALGSPLQMSGGKVKISRSNGEIQTMTITPKIPIPSIDNDGKKCASENSAAASKLESGRKQRRPRRVKRIDGKHMQYCHSPNSSPYWPPIIAAMPPLLPSPLVPPPTPLYGYLDQRLSMFNSIPPFYNPYCVSPIGGVNLFPGGSFIPFVYTLPSPSILPIQDMSIAYHSYPTRPDEPTALDLSKPARKEELSVPGIPGPMSNGESPSHLESPRTQGQLKDHNGKINLADAAQCIKKPRLNSTRAETQSEDKLIFLDKKTENQSSAVEKISPKIKNKQGGDVSSSMMQVKVSRPTSLPLRPGTFKQKKIALMPRVSTNTSSMYRSQVYFRGHTYTYFGVKCATKASYCTPRKTQPSYLENRPCLSMYSNWRICTDEPPLANMAYYDFRDRPARYTVAWKNEDILTDSLLKNRPRVSSVETKSVNTTGEPERLAARSLLSLSQSGDDSK